MGQLKEVETKVRKAEVAIELKKNAVKAVEAAAAAPVPADGGGAGADSDGDLGGGYGHPPMAGLSADEIKKLEDESFKNHAFNEYKSSQLPLDRPVPDVRVKECQSLQWTPSEYPKASIIICFVNEAWSALLRTVRAHAAVLSISNGARKVWSVLNRSPPELIHEIILFDDASDAPW